MRVAVVVALVVATASSAADTLGRRGWRVVRDRDTGVPAQLWGRVDAPGSVADGAIAERVARAFLAEHTGELAPGGSDFELVANRLDGNLRTVGFAQVVQGRRVVRGQIGFVFGNDRLFAIISTLVPDVRVTLPKSATQAAKLTAIVRVGHTDHAVQIVDVDAGHERWRVYRDANGRELLRESRIMTSNGTLKYNAGVRYGWGARADYPAPDAAITVDGVAMTTGSDGTFSWTSASAASVSPTDQGTYVRVRDTSGAPSTTLTAQPSATIVWNAATDPLADAHVSAFIYTSIAKQRARQISTTAASWLAGTIDVYVNETFLTCNAYSTGDDIHFLLGSSSCENAARVADVVFHEFGHSLHNNSIVAGMGAFDTPLSEGLADFYAALITGDSGTARGFFLTDAPGREIDPIGIEYKYPQDMSADPHLTGLIISGALWDLRKALVAKLGATDGTAAIERIFAAVMARAPSIPGSYAAALIGDDNDSDLMNGTPNLCLIKAAFAPHGLYADTEPTKIGPIAIEGLAISIPVEAPSDCLGVTDMTVTWESSGGMSGSFALSAQGTTWTGTFPDQPDRSVLGYSVRATLVDGTVRMLPDNPADPMYQQFIGATKPIWCEPMDSDPMWRRANSAGAITWQWGQPNGGMYDPPAAFTGTNVLGMTLQGDGVYPANDLSYVDSPLLELDAYDTVYLQYRRWLTVESGGLDEAMVGSHPESVPGTQGLTKLWHNLETLGVNHVDREWRLHHVDLTAIDRSEPLSLRWVLKANAGTELGGWTLDDVCVVTADPSVCGDQEISGDEQCDDGNREDGDGCSKFCTDEGGCCSASASPLGPCVLAILLGLRLRRRRRA